MDKQEKVTESLKIRQVGSQFEIFDPQSNKVHSREGSFAKALLSRRLHARQVQKEEIEQVDELRKPEMEMKNYAVTHSGSGGDRTGQLASGRGSGC